MDVKQLKKIAAACRKAGITHFKNAEFEFTLTENEPVPVSKRQKASSGEVSAPVNKDFQSDSITKEELLFWSVSDDPTKEEIPAPFKDK